MATVYEKADASVTKVLDKVIEKHFPDLKEAAPTIQAIMADAGVNADEEGVPAVKEFGRPVPAMIKQRSLKDRVAGFPDVELLIDKRKWDDADEKERQAVMHHALMRLEVRRDDAGQVVTDDIGRPKFGKRAHDWVLTGFHATAKTFGEHAVEVQEATSFQIQNQYVFEFAARG